MFVCNCVYIYMYGEGDLEKVREEGIVRGRRGKEEMMG